MFDDDDNDCGGRGLEEASRGTNTVAMSQSHLTRKTRVNRSVKKKERERGRDGE
jgi:hypothetical protein